MEYQYILVEQEETIQTITLNRPAKLNALNWDLIGEVATAIEEADRSHTIGCSILTGAGDRAFAAGADIGEMSGATPALMLTGPFQGWDRIRRAHKPIIAAVNGLALGGGCELAMHCDLILASEKARFGQPEINLGVIPGAGGTQRLAHSIGKFKTMEMVLTGAMMSAQDMYVAGLVNHVYPAEQLMDEAKKLAREIAAKAPIAVRLAKDAVLRAFEAPLEEGLAHEKRNFALLFSTEDQKEGMQAFLEKRPAKFQGK
ncbi:MAG TPA: enoyl-CoA hydratase-related protein [Ktedonobacterales bacterium]